MSVKIRLFNPNFHIPISTSYSRPTNKEVLLYGNPSKRGLIWYEQIEKWYEYRIDIFYIEKGFKIEFDILRGIITYKKINIYHQLFDIKDKYMFQKRPMKLAKRTRNWMGTYIRFMSVAAGQIFQFTIIVSFILFFTCSTPLRALL